MEKQKKMNAVYVAEREYQRESAIAMVMYWIAKVYAEAIQKVWIVVMHLVSM